MNLFEYSGRKESLSSSPLSTRMRPKSLDEFIGQEHILGKGKALYNLVENKTIPSKKDSYNCEGCLGLLSI